MTIAAVSVGILSLVVGTSLITATLALGHNRTRTCSKFGLQHDYQTQHRNFAQMLTKRRHLRGPANAQRKKIFHLSSCKRDKTRTWVDIGYVQSCSHRAKTQHFITSRVLRLLKGLGAKRQVLPNFEPIVIANSFDNIFG